MATSLPVVLAFGAMILWSIGDFLIQRTSKKLGSLETLIFLNLISAVILFPFIVKGLSKLNWQNITPLFILSILEFAFGLTLLKAYEKGKLSVVVAIMTIELPLTVTWGILFFKERLSIVQIVLIIIIFAGVFFIAREKLNVWQKILTFFSGRSRLEKGALIALAAAFFSSFFNLFIAINVKEVSPFMTLWLPWTLNLVWLFIFFFIKNGPAKSILMLKNHAREYKYLIVYGAVIDTFAWLCYAGAVAQKELSITTAITESYPALAMFLGIKFNKEKISGLQYIGALLALGGSVVIALIS